MLYHNIVDSLFAAANMILFISATIENFHVVETLADNAIIVYQTHKVMVLSFVPKDRNNSDSNIQICYSKLWQEFKFKSHKISKYLFCLSCLFVCLFEIVFCFIVQAGLIMHPRQALDTVISSASAT